MKLKAIKQELSKACCGLGPPCLGIGGCRGKEVWVAGTDRLIKGALEKEVVYVLLGGMAVWAASGL